MTCVIFIYVSNRNKINWCTILLLPCEVGVKTVLPAVRALMARTIVEKHGMKEQQAAEILGLSQSAISRYTSKNRGNTITIENVPEVQTLREKGLICQLCQEKTGRTDLETCDFCRSN
jgi:predicted transcriptional regulator